MKKLILKTVLITLACVIGAMIIIFFSLFAFAPKVLGKFFGNARNYSLTAYFYEKQYNKDNSIESLAILIDVLDENRDAKKTADYCKEMVSKDGFIDYCKKTDEQSGIKIMTLKTAEYYYAKYAIASFNEYGIDNAIEVCKSGVSVTGYTENNAFRHLFLSIENISTENKQKISSAIKGLNGLNDIEKEISQNDVNSLK